MPIATGESLQSRVKAIKQHGRGAIFDGDVYRVTHRSGKFVDVRATSINDARRWAAGHYGWKQLDMHVRIIELNGAAPERRNNRLLVWLAGALPFNLWR